MNKIRIYTATLLLALTGFMSSCIMHDELEDCPQNKQLRVKATIEADGSGGSNIAWPAGSIIGVTVFNAGTNDCFGDNFDKRYDVSDTNTGDCDPGKADDPIYLPDDGSMSDAIAYYPYSTPFDRTLMTSLSIADQSVPDSLDLITSDRECSIRPDAELVHLKFYRRLTKVIFNITLIAVAADGTETIINERLPGTRLDINGLPVDASYFLPDNQLTTGNATQLIHTAINKEGTKAAAIVFPRTPDEGVSFIVTLPDGTQKTFYMDPELELTAGMENVFDLVIKIKGGENPDPAPDPKPEIHKVTYELQGIPSRDIHVGRGEPEQKWLSSSAIDAEEGSDFVFRISDIDPGKYDLTTLRVTVNNVNVKLTNGSYTIRNITENKHIVIRIEEIDIPVPPAPVYTVTYELIGTFNEGDILLTNTADADDQAAWLPTEAVRVRSGNSNTFGMTLREGITAEWTSNVTTGNQADTEHTFANIRQNIHIKIYRVFKVTLEYSDGLSVNKDDVTTVEEGKDYTGLKPTFDKTVYDETTLTVTVDGTPVTAETDETYQIPSITSDKHIVISIKPLTPTDADQPDKIISASVHVWDDYYTIDGGTITPNKK